MGNVVKGIILLIVGVIVGAFSLSFHPQFSYYGVEFYRAQAPKSLNVLDYPAPYALHKGDRRVEARLATQHALQKNAVSRLEIEKHHFGLALAAIRQNFQLWTWHLLQKLGLFFGYTELQNPYLFSQYRAYAFTVCGLSLLALLGLFLLIPNPMIQFSWGIFLSYYTFYASSSIRLFLIPLYVILIYLLSKKLLQFMRDKSWLKLSASIIPVLMVGYIAAIPFIYRFPMSHENLAKIHKANGYLIQGQKLLNEKKKYLAQKVLAKGLKTWSYHSSIRVELAKIYLEEKSIRRALNLLRNPKNNPFAHEILAEIFMHYPPTSHYVVLKNLERAIELRPFEKRFQTKLAQLRKEH